RHRRGTLSSFSTAADGRNGGGGGSSSAAASPKDAATDADRGGENFPGGCDVASYVPAAAAAAAAATAAVAVVHSSPPRCATAPVSVVGIQSDDVTSAGSAAGATEPVALTAPSATIEPSADAV
ncbi:hypothetical protein Vafri_4844, partial [Volvox africanus]